MIKRKPGENHLTRREAEVMKWVCLGKTTNDIALITGLSHHTVKNFIHKAYKRLGAENRAQAVGMLLRAENVALRAENAALRAEIKELGLKKC